MKDGVPERKASRLATYNYSQSGVYFITICSKNKRCTFGTIVGGGVPDAPRTRLSPTGKIVARQLGNMIAFYPHVRIEKYVVMPNHIHLLIAIQQGPSGASRTPPPTSARASQVIPMFISTLKRLTNKTAGHALWQRGYYDHIIRSPDDYNTNLALHRHQPRQWAQDTLYVTDFPDPVRRPGCCTNKEVTQMSRYFTKTLAALEPYTPGEQLKLPDLVKLNANENPYPPAPGVAAAVAEAVPGLRLYSDLTEAALCAAIARHCGVQPENILCGNGSDENLLLALRAFCDETHPLAFADITYSFYPVLCDLLHIPQHVILVEEDFSLDLSKYHGLNETIVIANPNAPTGIALPRAEIEGILKANPNNVVIVDEAYVDFGGESCVPLIDRYENLLVVQTFSKSRQLAGARLGLAMGNAKLIADLNRVKFSLNPYNINRLTLKAGQAALEDTAYFDTTRAAIVKTRSWTRQQLEARGFTVLDSRSNFLFARTARQDGGTLYRKLKENGVLVRHFDAPRIRSWLRITIGTPAQMQALLAALDKILED